MFTSVSLMSLLRSLVLDLDLDLDLDLELDLEELKDFFSEVDKLHKTDEAVTAKIANNPKLAKALTDPNLTPTQKQQLATERWMAEVIMPDFLISLAICILPFLVSSLVSNSPFKPL
jgi:hypothetical protein